MFLRLEHFEELLGLPLIVWPDTGRDGWKTAGGRIPLKETESSKVRFETGPRIKVARPVDPILHPGCSTARTEPDHDVQAVNGEKAGSKDLVLTATGRHSHAYTHSGLSAQGERAKEHNGYEWGWEWRGMCVEALAGNRPTQPAPPSAPPSSPPPSPLVSTFSPQPSASGLGGSLRHAEWSMQSAASGPWSALGESDSAQPGRSERQPPSRARSRAWSRTRSRECERRACAWQHVRTVRYTSSRLLL
eukprot:1717558-Rhodomonas_salina.7